jgi:phosphoglycolate phosphatase-like HAD superfamily hydrolase
VSRFAVILLDVDGTLVHAGGAGRRSIERALLRSRAGRDAVAPVAAALAALRLDGMTDRLIVREGLALLGEPWTDAACDAVLAAYLEHLRDEIAGPGYAVLPGVEPLLEQLAARGAAYGLCTGNVAEGARLKLARGGLDRWFRWGPDAIGGFAEDGEARERVVEAALRRASARLGRALSPREALVVGDTPRDVAAAHAVGCVALAVATGRYAADELAATGADHVARDLGDPAALRLVLGA